MKRIYFLFFAAALPVLLTGQTRWTRHESPVLPDGPEGSWDEGVFSSSVLPINDTLHMWYGGVKGDHIQIGHATSLDGTSWTRDTLNPVLPNGVSGSPDHLRAYLPHVYYDGSSYCMYYVAASGEGSVEIGEYAISEDGGIWEKHPDTATFTLNGENYLSSGAGEFWYRDGMFHKWGNRGNGTGGYYIVYYTSADGIHWEMHSENPALKEGGSLDWDWSRAQVGTVLRVNGMYHMFYCGGSFMQWQIGYAYSEDGIQWTKYQGNPVLKRGVGGSWDSRFVGFPSVIYDEEEQVFRMWYSGSSSAGGAGIGYATAPLDTTVGIFDQHAAIAPFSLYPNPARDLLYVKLNDDATHSGDPWKLEVFSMTGQLIESRRFNGSEAEINASTWHPGVYLIQLTFHGMKVSRKWIKE